MNSYSLPIGRQEGYVQPAGRRCLYPIGGKSLFVYAVISESEFKLLKIPFAYEL